MMFGFTRTLHRTGHPAKPSAQGGAGPFLTGPQISSVEEWDNTVYTEFTPPLKPYDFTEFTPKLLKAL